LRLVGISIYPAISRDATAYNWRRKKDIFRIAAFILPRPVIGCSMKVHNVSRLGIVESRIIPYGIDLRISIRPIDEQFEQN
jgi:hypothetical protein